MVFDERERGLGAPAGERIVDHMLSGATTNLLPLALLDDYRAVLLQPKLSRLHGLTEQEIDVLLIDLVANAIWREPDRVEAAPDPGDIRRWALMGSHPGTILITGDRLLIEQSPDRASVVSPRTYVERFSQNAYRSCKVELLPAAFPTPVQVVSN
jgi:predicted nucleic acid-binding protein